MKSPSQTESPWLWPPQTPVHLGVVLLDRVGSTKESQALSPEEASNRQARFQKGVEDLAIAHGAYDRFNWQGDGLLLLFTSPDPKTLPQTVVQAGIDLWQRIHSELGMHARIACHVVAEVSWNPDPGRLSHREINLCGHLEKDAPNGSMVISDDVYWLLDNKEQELFTPLGVSERDGIFAYAYPKNTASGSFHRTKDFELWEKFRSYCQGPEIATMPCIGFSMHRQVPRYIRVEEVFVQPTFEIDVERFSEGMGLAGLWLPTDGRRNIPLTNLRRDTIGALGNTLGRKRNVAILGEPGSGKSTLLRWLALVGSRGRYSLAFQTGLDEKLLALPVSVGRLAEIKSALGDYSSVPQALARYFHSRSIGSEVDIQAFLEKQLGEGHCLLLLDGLDETAEKKVDIAHWLEAFASVYPKNRFVISSRVLGYAGIRLPDVEENRIAPFSDDQVEQYLDAFHRAFLREQAKIAVDESQVRERTSKLLDEIRTDSRLVSVARNPFMLLTLALIHLTDPRLPRHRVQFYQLASRTLCETWANARRLVPGNSPETVHFEETLPILGALAIEMHKHHPQGTAPRAWVENTLASALRAQRGLTEPQAQKTANNFMEQVSHQAGLLREQGPDEWGFLHLSFQEFFVAAGLHAREEFEDQAVQHLFEPRWEEILRLGVGHLAFVQGRLKAAANFVEQVTEAQAPQPVSWISQILHKQIPVAALLFADVAEAMEAEAKVRILGQFLKWVLEQPRANSARYLREVGRSAGETIAIILYRLFSRPEVRNNKQAIWAAGVLNHPSLIEPLLGLLEDADEEVRAAAAAALGVMATPLAFDKLVATLKSDPSSEVREECINALGQLQDPRAIHALEDVLADANLSVVSAAVDALVKIDQLQFYLYISEQKSELSVELQSAIVRHLPWQLTLDEAEILFAHPNSEVRMNVIMGIAYASLRVIGGNSWPMDNYLPMLKKALNDPDRIVRLWAVTGISIRGKDEKESLLIEAAQHDMDKFVASTAIIELANVSPNKARAILNDLVSKDILIPIWFQVADLDLLAEEGDVNALVERASLGTIEPNASYLKAKLLKHLWRFAERGPERLMPSPV